MMKVQLLFFLFIPLRIMYFLFLWLLLIFFLFIFGFQLFSYGIYSSMVLLTFILLEVQSASSISGLVSFLSFVKLLNIISSNTAFAQLLLSCSLIAHYGIHYTHQNFMSHVFLQYFLKFSSFCLSMVV